jgi:hypothetical protein
MPRSTTSKPAPFHHHRHEVLADVVDVALDGADHHLADARRAGFGQQRLQDRHAALHRVGGQQHLGHEEDAVAEIVADDGHAAHERLGQDVVGRPAAVQQDVHALFDLFLQTVVEVVEHLGDQIVVVELREDDVVFFPGHGRLLWRGAAAPFSVT